MVIRTTFMSGVIFVLVASATWFDTGHSADVKTEVTMRSSKHEGFIRIVFEAQDDAFLKSTVITSLSNQIKVQFPSNVNLKVRSKPEMETSLKENLYIININTPFKTKVSHLSSPPRLSVDISVKGKEEGGRIPAPENAAALVPNIRIVLDPGHGGYDLGILAGELREKDATLSVARVMEAALIKKNKVVYLTRKADQYLSITDRSQFSNQKAADIFISIHIARSNDFVIYTSPAESPVIDPVEDIYGMKARQRRYADKSKSLAESIGKSIAEEFKKDAVFRKMELPLLSSVAAGAVMVEVPETLLSDQDGKAKISETFLKGMASYAGQ
ncbi:MAG TPA: N-acetylmuramoyl-L-alanine amidase [Thermodesulfovibrionales bacterium]|nr:N-acetylmuramoyl-L-alanine amidase [Thermodesulfovibrionales bacterium]